MTQIDRLVVVLRHNTTLPSDAALALREWEVLLGTEGRPLATETHLREAVGNDFVADRPKLASGVGFVACVWRGVKVDGVVRLLRRSAFAQEVFLCGDDSFALASWVAEGAGAVGAASSDPGGSVVIALAHNYVIESEAVLGDDVATGRIRAVIAALLEPYRVDRPSPRSSRLRSAKKTTLSLSHDLHIYKAKFFPRMVRALTNLYGSEAAVFDPYCGSGTALLEASLMGQDCAGVDIDPICELISRSKVAPFMAGARDDVRKALLGFRAALSKRMKSNDFVFPEELRQKIVRRDRVDGTKYLDEITTEANILATALRYEPQVGVAGDLIRTLASDAVTKKIRYRFIGIGNGRYTIEIVKQSILGRVEEKIARSLQLLDTFAGLEADLGIKLGTVRVKRGDARDEATWPDLSPSTFVVTSPPYLPASSGREHYASSRALAFAVLGFAAGENGYVDTAVSAEELPIFDEGSEAGRLLAYLVSDADDAADPQRDAMRFERKAVPTAHYLSDVGRFARGLMAANPCGRLAMVVADQHTFYSHRRQVIEHVVDCASLYGQVMESEGLNLVEEIELQLMKSSASRAKPRAKDDYHEAVLLFEAA